VNLKNTLKASAFAVGILIIALTLFIPQKALNIVVVIFWDR